MAVAQREGKLRRNFQGYTADAGNILLGFGASAIGQLPQGYVQNAVHTGAYSESIASGRLATVRGCALTDDIVEIGDAAPTLADDPPFLVRRAAAAFDAHPDGVAAARSRTG